MSPMRVFPGRMPGRIRKLLGIGRRPEAHKDLKARFSYVYRERAWASQESASGPGSDRDSGSVRQSLIALAAIVADYRIRSIADLPCGDFNWMPLFLADHPDVDYAGYDIVDSVIRQNRQRHPERAFSVLDITRDIPPRADMVFSKDLVNHLLERDVWRTLANMIRSGATYLMITSNRGPVPNEELPRDFGGVSRPLNLQIAPYDFPPPLYDDGYLAMWRMEDLGFVLERALTRP